MQHLILPILLLTLFSACKTTEELQREQMVDGLSIQMVQHQKNSAEGKLKIQNLEQRIDQLNGILEEQGHKVDQNYTSKIKNQQEKMTLLEEAYRLNKEEQDDFRIRIVSLETKAKKQKKYIDKVLKILNKISKKGKDKSVSKKLSKYKQAFAHYSNRNYDEAFNLFISLEKNKKIKGNKKARVLHGIGMIYFIRKKYDNAIGYFSSLFTKYPKAPYTTNGLLYLGKTFYAKGEKEQAIQTLQELLKRHPRSKKIPAAKKLLKKYRK